MPSTFKERFVFLTDTNANIQLIKIYEQKIKYGIAEVWGDEKDKSKKVEVKRKPRYLGDIS